MKDLLSSKIIDLNEKITEQGEQIKELNQQVAELKEASKKQLEVKASKNIKVPVIVQVIFHFHILISEEWWNETLSKIMKFQGN